jgi:hypothetical protein
MKRKEERKNSSFDEAGTGTGVRKLKTSEIGIGTVSHNTMQTGRCMKSGEQCDFSSWKSIAK